MKAFFTFLLLLFINMNYNEAIVVNTPSPLTSLPNSYGLRKLNLVKTGDLSGNTNLTLTLTTGSLANSKLVSAYYSTVNSIKVLSQTNMYVQIQGTVTILSKVFKTSFVIYKCPTNTSSRSTKTCFAANSTVSIPTSLKTAILGVIGLEQVLSLKTNYIISRRKTKASANLIGPDVANIYGFPNSTGAGVRVGIIAMGGYFLQSDLQSFFTQFGLGTAPTINVVFINGAQLDFNDKDSSYENYLDVEIIASVVPQANITFYFAPLNNFKNMYDALYAALQQSDVISLSWAHYEVHTSEYWSSFQALFESFSNVPVFCAGGDEGSSIGVSFPASCPGAISEWFLI